MNPTQAHIATHETEHTGLAAGGALLEGFGAIATMALAIVGLAGVFATTMAAIATIVLGVSILSEVGTFGFKGGRIFTARKVEGWSFGTAATADCQSGIAAIVLGILALLGIGPM